MATLKGIPLSKVSPAFLHANSTSHSWIFSAFAELIDNAYDPDVSASELLIDKVDIRGVPCLIFLDNGAGIDNEHLLKMLSFGFCEKDIYEKQGSHQPIGHYGNGFKSGSMRMGMDALVFTRCQNSAGIGFLSQTYLKKIQADSVMVPILEYRLPNLERIKSQESRNNLNAILQYSVFRFESELKEELRALEGSKTGTKIIIYNLKKLQDSTYELDFASDPFDIRCPEAHEADMTSVYHRPIQHKASEYKRSLREYCSILFLRPRMKITIRGVRVKSRLIAKSLSNTEIDVYKPTWLSRPVKIIFGFTCETERPEDCDYGMMLYHRNRLIKAFEKVGYQKQPNGLGVGVVGVAQVDFLQPIHNKQDFNKDEKFNSVMSAFAIKLNEYWNEKKGSENSVQPAAKNLPDWLWAQCDHCLKWRRLPDEVDRNSLPDLWYCRMNQDATHNRCDIPEEPEDEDLAVRPTYEKTYKKKQEERKRLQQMEREKEENIKRRKIMEKEQELKEKEAALHAIQQVAAVKPLQETRTVISLQKALAEARRREEQQKRLILQMQEQKKAMLEERNSLLVMAENLQTTEGKSNKEVLEQLSQLLGTLNNQSVPTPSLPGKRKSDEGSTSSGSRKGKKKLCIKTETGEVLSITENDDDGGGDDNDDVEDGISPMLGLNQPKVTEVNVSTTETCSSSVTPLRQHESSLPTSGSTYVLAINNTTHASVASASLESANTETADSLTPKRRRKRQKEDGPVLAVIDLTSENEFGELMEVKPSLDDLHVTLQESLQSKVANLKTNSDSLDVAMTRTENIGIVKEINAALKEEIAETTSQNTFSVLPTKKSDCDQTAVPGKKLSIHFGPTEDDPEFMMSFPDSFHDNLEAAMAAIQDRFEKEKSQQETHPSKSATGTRDEDVIKDEVDENNMNIGCSSSQAAKQIVVNGLKVADFSSNLSKVHGDIEKNIDNTRHKNKENDMFSGLSLKDLLPLDDGDGSDVASDDNSDYRDYSAVDEKGNMCEPHIDRQKCSNIPEGGSRRNSSEECRQVSNRSDDTVDRTLNKQKNTHKDHYCLAQCQIHDEMAETLFERHNSKDSMAEATNSTYSGENSSECQFLVEEKENSSNVLTVKKTSNKDSPLQDSLTKKSSKVLKLTISSLGGAQIDNSTLNKVSAFEHSSQEVKEMATHPVVDHSCVQSEASDESCLQESYMLMSFVPSVNFENYTSVKKLVAKGADPTVINSCGDALSGSFEGKTADLEMNSVASTNHSDHPPSYLTSPNSTKSSFTVKDIARIMIHSFQDQPVFDKKTVRSKIQKSKRKSEQCVQTDLDMTTIEDLFTKECKLGPLKSSQEDTEKELTENKGEVKSNPKVEAEIQTEDFSNKEDLETLNDLQTKLFLKTQSLEKMEEKLSETRKNIHKLLGFIVPDAELGDVNNIDGVVKDMIRHGEESAQQNSQGTSNTSNC